MASRITLYGSANHPEIKRLKREMNVMYVEYDQTDPRKDLNAQRHLTESLGEVKTLPLVEVQRDGGNGSIFLTNPDEPTLRQCLYSENILSITSYWL